MLIRIQYGGQSHEICNFYFINKMSYDNTCSCR